MSISIDLGQAIHALADALDLVGVDEVLHGKRAGLMALQCGRGLHLNDPELEDLFHVGLLHDCAVSSTTVHRRLVNELDWEGAEFHCVRGAEMLGQFPPLAHLAPVIRYHHTHWSVLRTLELPKSTAVLANLIYLVDRVDALATPYYDHDLLLIRHGIRDTIWKLGGSFFASDLVALFMELSDNEAFWLSLESRHLIRFIYERERQSRIIPISFPELRQLALLFAWVVDAKSPYTMEHSLGTARLARFLAERADLPVETCEKIEIAGLLHDLGKLRVPDEILEKPGALTREERALIQRHSFETYQILRGITGLEDITLWAAYHHETPDGRGYPFHRSGVELTVEMRIIAVADVFQALAQQRPYRKPLSPDQILEMLGTFVGQNRLDGNVVELVRQHLAASWQAAIGQGV
ncbi:HD-GYP domain-containing protein [Candidatus Contendibacter odensensis]|uniref:Homeodomain protein n=1 Tax=Candidatus Contendobacter odensis Run_B_J11 TaxID=1400861 RepID=A0A7U7G9U4_9GAMM|nr:HD domain-containing phosphohydrolase [Candidatus Contendobacter odensis]CDH44116.1 Homeodomain protein [Candidatus Contendobacter odensis Run_B_J11]